MSALHSLVQYISDQTSLLWITILLYASALNLRTCNAIISRRYFLRTIIKFNIVCYLLLLVNIRCMYQAPRRHSLHVGVLFFIFNYLCYS